MHIDDTYLLFHNILMMLYWIDIWWLWRPFEYSHCYVQEACLRWFQLYDMTRPAASEAIRRWTQSAFCCCLSLIHLSIHTTILSEPKLFLLFTHVHTPVDALEATLGFVSCQGYCSIVTAGVRDQGAMLGQTVIFEWHSFYTKGPCTPLHHQQQPGNQDGYTI